MNMIRYKINDRCIPSCLIGSNVYTVRSNKGEYDMSLLEEVLDPIHQTVGRRCLRVHTQTDMAEFWLVPIDLNPRQTLRFLDAVEELMSCQFETANIFAPIDVVSDGEITGYLIRPFDRTISRPLRTFMPAVGENHWRTACSLFSTIKRLHSMGLTSNGFSREQVRVYESDEVALWLSDTVSTIAGSDSLEDTMRHEGFLSLPTAVENACTHAKIKIDGRKRDMFSAAVSAFYLLLCSHPFVGCVFNGLLREDYLLTYLYRPLYIMAPDTENGLGNQQFGRFVAERWSQTCPALKVLFDQMFSVAIHPELLNDNSALCWDPDRWIDVLRQDMAQNAESVSKLDFNFKNEAYHLV